MANNCYFEMKIVGSKASVEEFIRMISYKDEFKDSGLGRVYSFNLISEPFEQLEDKPGYVAAYGAGDCAWSLKSALCDTRPRNLLNETERLNLVIEAYSSEPGVGFQEHIIIDRGSFIENECVDYKEYWVNGAGENEQREMAEELGISLEDLINGTNEDGDYTIGGFGDDFGNFENLISYLKEPELDEMIQIAEEKTMTSRPNHIFEKSALKR